MRRTSPIAWLSCLLVAACSSSSSGGGNLDLDGGTGGPDATDFDVSSPDGFILPDFGAPGEGGDESGGPTSTTLTATIRDFKIYDAADPITDPDFENVPKTDQNGNPSTTYLGPWDDPNIVADTLGSDGKPVYKNASGVTLTTHGKDAFDKWYRDVAGTNVNVQFPLQLSKNADGSFGYDSEVSGVPLGGGDNTKMFFPIDDGSPYATAFGNQGNTHNYSFTVELHTTFVYAGGEYFSFRGDDDVFVYIDGKLVINLGGIHGPEPKSVQVDDLKLVKGQQYPLDFFSAERHVTGSNILFTTTLDLKPVIH